ncbi:MAG: DNA replication/repair protein RecF [Candidatus Contendobacter sp.]|jgi:DNA replication and repair protein RecF|nr:DNA replication/repair protein RecF [Gammaproteobacteria bacterium]MCC8995452.1 DNA replication/repair protein RecF [Candidatus Contendobacter sp.]
MRVTALDIAGFRNLRRISLACGPGLNLILGPNASGKTSLLEALYFLGRGRSFRTRQPRDLIQTGVALFRIVAWLAGRDGRRIPVGVERDAHALTARIGGAPTRSLAELARQAPVLLLNPDSHRLLEDGPQLRRRFMDWGLFHAEPGFLESWRRYGTALRHRNAALRTGSANRTVDAWDGELATAATVLDSWREAFCKALEGALAPLAVATLGMAGVQVDYRRGWPLEPFERGFADWLREGRDQDRKQGHTRIGPHRADFTLRIAGRPSGDALSRGQQKLLVIALVLAQAELYQRHAGASCILLIDDLPAELDAGNRERVMQTLAGLDAQLFITALEPGLLNAAPWREARVFQLADGVITPP